VIDFRWTRLDSPAMRFETQKIDREHSRLQAIPFFPGDYLFGVSVDDGQDIVSAEIAIHIVLEEQPPESGMMPFVLPLGRDYETDVYEYPNRKGEVPVLVGSWFEAVQICMEQGKRLCSKAEWQYACQGEGGAQYSSYDDPQSFGRYPFGLRFCNTPGSEFAGNDPDPFTARAPSGSFPNCVSSMGVYDLTGNVGEWVGQFNALGYWVGSTNADAVISLRPCSSSIDLPPLPVGFDFSQELSQEEIDALDNTNYSRYMQVSTGFRCCR
jgi:hypothetical protein